MIEHIDITSAQKSYQPAANLRQYITKKLGKLDRYMSRKNRPNSRVEVKLEYRKTKSGEQFSCEAILHAPDYKLTAQETTPNMYASVDVVEAKLQAQIKKFKDTHNPNKDKKSHQRTQKILDKIFKRN